MTTINLDVKREERRKDKEPSDIVLGGKSFLLPLELPLEVITKLGELSAASKKKDGAAISGILVSTMEVLLTADDFKTFMKLKPAVNDLSAIVEGIPEAYGLSVGESEASASS